MSKRQIKLLTFLSYILFIGLLLYAFQRIIEYLDQKARMDKLWNVAMLSAFGSIIKTNNQASDWASSFNTLTD